MEPVYLSLRWQNFLTISVMVIGLALIYTVGGQVIQKITGAGGSQ